MDSSIDDETAKDLEWKPRAETTQTDPDLPRSIPTLATETAPAGHIIDDSARGTIFWEAESSDDDSPHEVLVDGETSDANKDDKDEEPSIGSSSANSQPFGRPFRIKWASTSHLPFYKVRGLRNPWNANREVKIARDGTELETSVGRRLVAMFHRPPPPHQQPQPSMPQQAAFPQHGLPPIMYNMPPYQGRY